MSPGRSRIRARRPVVAAGLVSVTLLGLVGAGCGGGGGGDRADAPSTTTTAAPTSTTTTTVVLPTPEPPPPDPYAPTPLVEFGRIEIPRIGLVHTLYEGITLTVLDRGPGHWPGSARPCERGNAVFPGHRTTYSRPFHDLDLVQPGDQVVITLPGRMCVYEATGTQVVQPTDLWVTDQRPESELTLIACHPKGSAAQRIVLNSRLVADIPIAV
ncbi:MAG: sortase [Actinomycetota bacterium]